MSSVSLHELSLRQLYDFGASLLEYPARVLDCDVDALLQRCADLDNRYRAAPVALLSEEHRVQHRAVSEQQRFLLGRKRTFVYSCLNSVLGA